ncbi:hypothetical protein ACHAWF_002045 [Thalassiosira exigua]
MAAAAKLLCALLAASVASSPRRQHLAVEALAVASVAAPARRPRSIPDAPAREEAPGPRRSRRRFRVRRTRSSDVDAVASLLACESVPPSSNWNDGVKRLRAEASFVTQVGRRLDAVEEGRRTAARLEHRTNDAAHDDEPDDELCSVWDDDHRLCRTMWDHDAFRTKLRAAASCAAETNAWTMHDFALPPQGSEMMRHVLITVEEEGSGAVAGFCEVAWLPRPNVIDHVIDDRTSAEAERILVSDDALLVPPSGCVETEDSYYDVVSIDSLGARGGDDASSLGSSEATEYAPAVANLVASSSHRRMGVATRVLDVASRYARTQWRDDDGARGMGAASTRLGLYVRKENASARRLYRKRGFEVVATDVGDGLLYMAEKR